MMHAPEPSRSLIRAAQAGLCLVTLICIVLTIVGVPRFYVDSLVICEAPPTTCPEERYTSADVAAFEAIGLPVERFIVLYSAFYLVLIAVWWAVAAVIVARRSNDPMALLTATFLVIFPAVVNSPFVDTAPPDATTIEPWLRILVGLAQLVGELTVMGFFLLFPGGHFAPRWLRWVALALVPIFATDYLLPGTLFDRDEWPILASSAFFLAYLALQVGAQIYRYRRVSTADQRRQTKWIVFGCAVGLGLFFIGLMWTIAGGQRFKIPQSQFVFIAAQSAMLAVPITIGIAVLRHRLFDIEVIIRRTLIYSALTLILGLSYFGTVVLLQALFVRLTGQESALAIVASTLTIAALFGPLRAQVQKLIDRRFFRTKYDARLILESFALRANNETDLDTLAADLLSTIRVTMQPEQVSLWLPSPEQVVNEKRAS